MFRNASLSGTKTVVTEPVEESRSESCRETLMALEKPPYSAFEASNAARFGEFPVGRTVGTTPTELGTAGVGDCVAITGTGVSVPGDEIGVDVPPPLSVGTLLAREFNVAGADVVAGDEVACRRSVGEDVADPFPCSRRLPPKLS
jgi:hypothetical protein